MDNEKEMITKKAELYCKKNSKVHIKTTKDRFYNGYISEVSSDYIVFQDVMLGEIPIFFSEIWLMEDYRQK